MAGNVPPSASADPESRVSPAQRLAEQPPVLIGKRVFLVGCPRSGTTLLQSMLAAHPQIVSFPETHFFERVSPKFAALGLASPRRRDRMRLVQFLTDVGHPELENLIPGYAITLHRSISAFVDVLDALALMQRADVWVEKTPGHLHYVDLIEKHISQARFIHMVRDGEDVVASLYEVMTRHPEIWGGPATLEGSIARWIGDLELTRRHIHKSHHTLVRYEQLVDNPKPVLDRLCEFLQIRFSQEMLTGHSSAVQQLVLENEPWKDSAKAEGLQKPKARKFEKLFDRQQQAYVRARLADHDISEVDQDG
jgi:hypothetical protein